MKNSSVIHFGDDTEIYFEYEKKRITKVSITKEAKKND